MSSHASSMRSSRASSPTSRFQGQANGAEEVLKSQTVGLVNFSDFRKRQAEALEHNTDGSFIKANFASSTSSFDGKTEDGVKEDSTHRKDTNTLVSADGGPARKKKRKVAAKSKLSFPVEDEDGSDVLSKYASPTPDFRSKEASPDRIKRSGEARTASPILSEISDSSDLEKERRVGPNKNLSAAPKVMTKAALLREAQTREKLRKDFLALQEAVKGTEIIVPFVFYDGTNIPGGKCKVKKRDFIWMLLDRCRRVGAGVGSGEGEMNSSRREWARIGVDDLLLVRGEVIIPHHYEIYYFIVNKTPGPGSIPLFDYTDTVSTTSISQPPPAEAQPEGLLIRPATRAEEGIPKPADLENLEGADADPTFTKVVDRRWYERNKHIYPASVWREFDPAKDYSTSMRRDAQGNAFFFS